MKTCILTLISLTLITMKGFGQQNNVKDAFLEKWKNSSEYLLEIAKTFPEDSLDFKPAPRQMSVKEQLIHIRSNMLWLGGTYFNTGQTTIPSVKKEIAGKQELIAALEEAFQAVHTLIDKTDPATLAEEVDFFAGPKSRLQILNLLQDHVTHHRGQLIVYMNLLKLSPPRYSGW